MNPVQRAALVTEAESLARRLARASVPRLPTGSRSASASPTTTGVPQSCLGTATAYLRRNRARDDFEGFVDRLDQLDRIEAQNQDNPKAAYRVLKQVLEQFLAGHPDLDTTELLYILCWAQRLLTVSGSTYSTPPRRGSRAQAPHAPRVGIGSPTGGFGQMRQALQDLQRKSGRKRK